MKPIPFSWIGRIDIIKMPILPKTIYRFNAIPIKIPRACFSGLELIFQKLTWNPKRPWIASAILERRTKLEGSQYLMSNYTASPL